MLHRLTLLAAAAAFALPAARAGAQDTTGHKPVTAKQVATNVGKESKRVYKRSEKAVRKAGRDTEAQARRTGRHLKRTVSRRERERQAADSGRGR